MDTVKQSQFKVEMPLLKLSILQGPFYIHRKTAFFIIITNVTTNFTCSRLT